MTKPLLETKEIFVIDGFLSETACRQLIDRSEKLGYGDAPVTTHIGALILPDIRNNTRVMTDDPELADQLFQLARPHLPATLPGGWQLVGLNERLRYYRYDVGQRFAPHYDGAFARNKHERSHLTLMIYLNDGFEGGETKFYEEGGFVITPRCGSVLVFVHRKMHEGAALISGRKYVLRTDAMYRRSGGWQKITEDSSNAPEN